MKLEKNTHSCTYCHTFLSRFSTEPWDHIISESQNFVAVPTLGSILPGWVLIVPKMHVIRLSELSTELTEELLIFARNIGSQLQESFGQVTFFEHGPLSDESLLGCGINHAHLHVLSSQLKFSDAISNYTKVKYEWEQIYVQNPFTYLKSMDDEYLLYWENGSHPVYTKATNPTSQYFRQVIANSVGKNGDFDYKKKSFIDNVLLTLDALGVDSYRMDSVSNG